MLCVDCASQGSENIFEDSRVIRDASKLTSPVFRITAADMSGQVIHAKVARVFWSTLS